ETPTLADICSKELRRFLQGSPPLDRLQGTRLHGTKSQRRRSWGAHRSNIKPVQSGGGPTRQAHDQLCMLQTEQCRYPSL
ncbi:hypothetical protein BGZ83_001198, partial [Gryganskiella cystojenkinii]